jgi:uncharacterized membrane protein (DUF2068 family)
MNGQLHRPPVALRTIALFEIAKGVLVLAAAYGLIQLRHTDLHAATDAFLLRHGIDPETRFRRLFIESVAKATHYPVGQIAGFAVAYAIVRFAEGFGLWQGKAWAEWFAVISVGLYLPLELRHFVLYPTFLSAGVILLNIALILYLGNLLVQQRARLDSCPAQPP